MMPTICYMSATARTKSMGRVFVPCSSHHTFASESWHLITCSRMSHLLNDWTRPDGDRRITRAPFIAAKEEEVILQIVGYGPSGTTVANQQGSLLRCRPVPRAIRTLAQPPLNVGLIEVLPIPVPPVIAHS